MPSKLRLLFVSCALVSALALSAHAGFVSAQGSRAPSASAGACQNFQLLVRPVRGSGAAGHFGVMYRIRNISIAGCMLSGFPGVVLLDSRFTTLRTHLTWSTELAGRHAVRIVHLAPNGTAYFVLYWAEIPTGNEPCHPARYLMITAPNDRLPIVTYAGNGYSIHPCGGRITASPIEPAPFSI